MGRPIPPQPVILHNNGIIVELVHGILTVSVLYTTLAIVFFLCGPRPRKSSLPPPSPPPKSSSSSAAEPKSSSPPPLQPSSSSSSPKAPPLPPSRSMIITHVKANKEPTLRIGADHKDGAGGGRIGANHKDGAGGGRRLMMSLSQKLTRSWTLKKEAHRARGKSASTTFDEGDLIWKKQIILGERCRVPPSGGEDEDDVPVYDEHGLRIAPYHPRTPRSLPVSRTTSAIDMSAINFS